MVSYRKYTKKPTMKRRYTKPKVSKEIKKYVRKVTGPRPELKCLWYNDKEYNLDTLSNQAYIYNFTQLAQGTSRYSRVGNKVVFKGVHVKGVVKNNVAKTNFIRMLILRCGSDVDLSVSGTLDVFSENLAGTGAGASTITGLEAMYAGLNKAKFKVLYDKIIRLGATGSTDGMDAKFINYFHKLNHPIKYEGNTYGAGNQSQQLFVMFLTSEAADDSSGGVVELSHTTRAWFADA